MAKVVVFRFECITCNSNLEWTLSSIYYCVNFWWCHNPKMFHIKHGLFMMRMRRQCWVFICRCSTQSFFDLKKPNVPQTNPSNFYHLYLKKIGRICLCTFLSIEVRILKKNKINIHTCVPVLYSETTFTLISNAAVP